MTDRKLARLHLLARVGTQGGKLVPGGGPGELDSGNWDVTAEFAEQAIDAEIHLHEKKADKSWKAGRIISARPSDDYPGRFVFRFKVDPSLERTHRTGWGMEQARVWEGQDDGGANVVPMKG